MSTEISQYRSAVRDALGRSIPDEGDLRVWLDDDTEDRRAPEGWVHLLTSREVCFLLLTGRVVELSLDHDLGGDQHFGTGGQVIDFLVEQQGLTGQALWPRDGITLHTANSHGRDSMARSIVRGASVNFVVEKDLTTSGKPRFTFRRS